MYDWASTEVLSLQRLKVAVDGFAPSDDGCTFVYRVKVENAGFEWTLLKRFSEFYALHCRLEQRQLAALPRIPAKSFFRPNDPEIAEERQHKLNEYLIRLLIRPDLRLTSEVVGFLEIEDHSQTTPMEFGLEWRPWLVDNLCRLAVTDFSIIGERGYLFTTHKDTSATANLGKAWQMLDNEERGGIVFSTSEGDAVKIGKRTADGSFSANITEGQTAVYIYNENLNHFWVLVGSEGGEVRVLQVTQSIKGGGPELSELGILPLYIRAQILSMDGVGDRLLTVGSDGGIRLMKLPPSLDDPSLILSGGRIIRPLSPDESLTCGILHRSTNYAFIGTDRGKLLIYAVSINPPRYIATLDLLEVLKIHEGLDGAEYSGVRPKGLGVTKMLSSSNLDALFVAVESTILILWESPLASEEAPIRVMKPNSLFIGAIDAPMLSSLPVSAMTLWDWRSNEESLILVVAYHRTLSAWGLDQHHLAAIIDALASPSPDSSDKEETLTAVRGPQPSRAFEVGSTSLSEEAQTIERPLVELLMCRDEFQWGRINVLKLCQFESGQESQTPAVCLFAGTTFRGIQGTDLQNSLGWTTWRNGLVALKRLGDRARQNKDVARALPKQLSDSEDDVDLDLLTAFGNARFSKDLRV